MDILEKILTLSIGGTTIGFIIVFLGKFFLEKSSEVIIENHKNQLEILKTEHQIKFSKLHEERAEIIKIIHQDFFELENKLEYMTTLAQGPGWQNEKNRDEDAIEKYKETYERIEKSRIYFSENLCIKFKSALEEYYNVIQLMVNAKNKAKYELDGSGYKFPENEGYLDLWKNAENKVKNDIKVLRLELAEEFRKLIGV